MFEGRLREYKQGLAEQATPFLDGDEEVRAVALAQTVSQSYLFAAMGLGLAMVAAGLVGGAHLPVWVSIAGIALFAGVWTWSVFWPRRLLVRTGDRLYVFALPRSERRPLEPPLAAHDLAEIPPPSEGTPELGGERLHPSGGAPAERDAIRAALGWDPASAGP